MSDQTHVIVSVGMHDLLKNYSLRYKVTCKLRIFASIPCVHNMYTRDHTLFLVGVTLTQVGHPV